MPYASRRTALVLAAGALAAQRGIAQPGLPVAFDGWPTRPVRIVVGFPGGSSPDLVARTLAEPLSRALGQPVIVENKSGAGGNIAADAVVRATDGHTLGLMINGNLTIARLVNPKVTYDPLRDLAPISLVASSPLLLAVPATLLGVRVARDFLPAARSASDRWSYGSPGIGTVAHIGMEQLAQRIGMRPVHVPYTGNPQVIAAMIAGDIQLALLPPGLTAVQVRAGRLRAVAVTSASRSTLVPEVPSLVDIGIGGIDLEIWNAVAAPQSMPLAVRAMLAATLSHIVRLPEVRAALFQQGWQSVGSTEEGLARRIRADMDALGAVVTARGIRAE